MKVMIVAPYFWPKIGGLEGYVLGLARSLVERKVEVLVVCSGEEDSIEEFFGIKIYRLKRLFKISNTPVHFNWHSKILRIIDREKPDFVNAHSPVPFISDVAAMAAKKRRIPFLLTYHSFNMYKDRSFWNLLIWVYKFFLERKTLETSARILGVSNSVGNQFKNFKGKFRVVYNSLREEDADDLDFEKVFDVVFVGSLDRSHFWKGLDLVIKSLKFFDGRLVVVGKGDYKWFYEETAKKEGVLDRVDFVGEKRGFDKRKIIGSSRILVAYPRSLNDAFPSVLLEAWANKTAFVGADIGVFREFVEDGVDGFLVRPLDPQALGEKISLLLKKEKVLRDSAFKGNKKLKENFLWKAQADKFLEVLDEIKV